MIFCVGLMAGVICAIWGIAASGDQKVGGLSSADLATLISGFGGALLGGSISWMLAAQASKTALQRDQEMRLEDEKAAATRTILKLLQISNGLHTLEKYISTAIAAAPVGSKMWQAVRPLSGLLSKFPEFDASDFVPFIAADKTGIVNRLMLIAQRYQADETAIGTYNTIHTELQAMLAPFSIVDPSTGSAQTEIPTNPEILSPFLIKIEVLEQLMQTIYQSLTEDLAEAKALCKECNSAMQAHFRGSKFIEIKI